MIDLMKQRLKISLLVLFFALINFNFASAALVTCTNDCTIGTLIATVRLIVNFLLSWAWLVSIVFIVWAGISMMLAGGNEERLTSAKTTLRNAILGFVVILLSFIILNSVIKLITGSGDLINAFDLIP